MQGTLRNVKELNTEAALSGPVIRGDSLPVIKHLEALKKFPTLREAYTTLAARALDIAKQEKKVPAEKIKAIQALLEDK